MTKKDEKILEIARLVIEDELTGLLALKDRLGDDFLKAVQLVQACSGRIIVTGMGKSGHIAAKIAATLASTGQPSQFVHPAEASHGDLGMIARDDVILALSRSGETPELNAILDYAVRFDIPVIAVTAGKKSALARSGQVTLLLPDAAEACAETSAPTTSTTMSLALGDALAVTLLRLKGFSKNEFGIFHPGGSLGAALRKVADIVPAERQPPLCHENILASKAIEILDEGGFGCVGLLDRQENLSGMITDGDVRRHLTDLRGPELQACQIMTKNPITVTSASLAGEALALMQKQKITALFVLEAGKPTGLLHIHDFLETGLV